MKNNVLVLLGILIFAGASAQQGGFEQYYYVQQNSPLVMMPIVHYQTKSDWYTEARLNYEDLNTFSIYAGKIFSRENKLSYSLIPILGGVMGNYKGGSVGLNANLEYKDFYFSSQSQYTVSTTDRTANFFYSWSELGVELSSWIYAGIALQHTSEYNTDFELGETGTVVGFSFGKWIFPLYSFNPMSSNRYFMLGINRTLNK